MVLYWFLDGPVCIMNGLVLVIGCACVGLRKDLNWFRDGSVWIFN